MFPKIIWKDAARTADGKAADSLKFGEKLLLKGRVSTTPGVAFGPSGEGHVRMTFCCPEDTIHKAFDRIEELFPV